MPKVKDLLMDAIRYDIYFLAYAVYIAVKQKIVSMDDDESKFYSSTLPFAAIQEAVDEDTLLLKSTGVKLYMVKYNLDYAIYLSKSLKEVEELHLKLFKEPANRIVEATHKKGTYIYDDQANKYYNFYELQSRTATLPHFCCLMSSKVKGN